MTTNTMTRTCIGYIRVSTADQASEGISLEAQRSRIQAWADMKGYKLVAIYEDAGLSGTKVKGRVGLEQALKAATAGVSLVAYSISRLARSTVDMGLIARRLEKQGAEMVSLTESIDTASATGKMIFGMLSVLAQFESDLISERTKSALQFLKSKGKKLGHADPRKGGEATRLRWAKIRAAKALEQGDTK